MIQKWIYFMLGGLITFYSCNSHDEEPELTPTEPVSTEPTFNKKDSLALVEIYKQGDGENWYSDWDLTDVMSWGGTGWAIVENEYRCVQLFMKAKDIGNGSISPQIGELEYLTKFEASGKTFSGEVPTSIKQLKHLKVFYLMNTLVSKIPDDMFHENFIQVYIASNEKLGGILPSSLTKLKGGECDIPKRNFAIIYNAYTGSIPVIKDAVISLEGNNLSSFPMEIAGHVKDGEYGVWAPHNRLSGCIPEDILKDTLRLYKFYHQVNLQQKGYGYSNMPSNEGIGKMISVYKINHPEFKE